MRVAAVLVDAAPVVFASVATLLDAVPFAAALGV